jgi:hypothetical protein
MKSQIRLSGNQAIGSNLGTGDRTAVEDGITDEGSEFARTVSLLQSNYIYN